MASQFEQAQTWIQSAEDSFAQGDGEHANLCFARALECGPQDPEVMNAVAVSIAQRGDLGSALALLTDACTLLPGNPVLSANLELLRQASAPDLLRNAHAASDDPASALLHCARPQTVHILLTSRCNLRCSYCNISGQHADPATLRDMAPQTLDKILTLLENAGIRQICLSGGEVTFMNNWLDSLHAITQRGFRIDLISNLARTLDDAEIAALSRLNRLSISMDSADRQLAQTFRSKSRLENIVYNIVRIRSLAQQENRSPPHMSISCVIGTQTLAALPNLIPFIHACGVREISLTDVTEAPQQENHLTSILRFDLFTREETARIINRVLTVAERLQVEVSLDPAVVEGLNGTPGHALAPGLTRACLDPWSLLLFKPNGDIHTCCTEYPPVARVDSVDSLHDIFFGPLNMQCKQELLDGRLHPICRDCVRKGVSTLEQFAHDGLQAMG